MPILKTHDASHWEPDGHGLEPLLLLVVGGERVPVPLVLVRARESVKEEALLLAATREERAECLAKTQFAVEVTEYPYTARFVIHWIVGEEEFATVLDFKLPDHFPFFYVVDDNSSFGLIPVPEAAAEWVTGLREQAFRSGGQYEALLREKDKAGIVPLSLCRGFEDLPSMGGIDLGFIDPSIMETVREVLWTDTKRGFYKQAERMLRSRRGKRRRRSTVADVFGIRGKGGKA